jgi:hypothetical protein
MGPLPMTCPLVLNHWSSLSKINSTKSIGVRTREPSQVNSTQSRGIWQETKIQVNSTQSRGVQIISSINSTKSIGVRSHLSHKCPHISTQLILEGYDLENVLESCNHQQSLSTREASCQVSHRST